MIGSLNLNVINGRTCLARKTRESSLDLDHAPRMRHAPISAELFIANRKRLHERLRAKSIVVVNANDTLPTNSDGTLRGVPNSDLFYLSGVEQEETVLVLFPDAANEKFREILFLRETSDLIAIWEGHKLTKDEARIATGIQNVQWLSEYPQIFHRLMCEAENVYLNSNEHMRSDIVVETREARFVASTVKKYPLHRYHRLARLMHELRVVKSSLEIELLQKACDITGKALDRVLKFVRPGVSEHEVEAEWAHEFIRNRAQFAYTPIIASGVNNNVLHYVANDQLCQSGELLLLDVAASYANYNSDLTRTIPVNGRFSPRQRQVYNSVLRVLKGLMGELSPSKRWVDWQKAAEEMVEKELVDLGLLTMRDIRKQDPENPEFRKYFMHGAGHPLGLDVHDVGFTQKPFTAGWVMTIEPAIYIREEGFGVRLENDVLITSEGIVDLMANIPIEPEAIEDGMQGRK